MGVPVSLRTSNEDLTDLSSVAFVGGLLILLIAMGPPVLLLLMAILMDLLIFSTPHLTFGWLRLEPDFSALACYIVGVTMPLWNLWLKVRGVHIRILWLPAWGFGLFYLGFGIMAHLISGSVFSPVTRIFD